MPEAVYDRIGVDYARGRRPDPRWQARVDAALGTARTVLNVGAGTGSYEPADRSVVAVEPSRTMIDQRPVGEAPVLQAIAEHLPVTDGQFDAAMALVTLHHWKDWAAGLREMQRVAERVVILHFDPALHDRFWLVQDYLPELADLWVKIPSVQQVAGLLGTDVEVRTLPVPWDCVDGFLPAFWRRPEFYLEPAVQQSMSGLQLLDPPALTRGLTQLRADLVDGTWQRKNSGLLERGPRRGLAAHFHRNNAGSRPEPPATGVPRGDALCGSDVTAGPRPSGLSGMDDIVGPTPASDVPVACTLGPVDGRARLRRWQRLNDSAAASARVVAGDLLVRYQPDAGVQEELADLAKAEQTCCSFVSWSVTNNDGQPVLQVSAPEGAPDAVAAIAAMFGAAQAPTGGRVRSSRSTPVSETS